VVTPGHHASAIRLGFGATLLRDGVHVRARVDDVGRQVELADEHGPVLVHALPYLDPDAVRRELADGDPEEDGTVPLLPRSHEAVMAAAMRRVRADLDRRASSSAARVRSVVMAHAFVVGGRPSDSERDIRVGGVDSVSAGVFAGVDYVALGHLHGPQQIGFATARDEGAVAGLDEGGDSRVRSAPTPLLRYSGSPLAYSFSERNHRKSSVIVELGPQGVSGEVELVPAPVPRRLTEIVGPLTDLLGAAGEPHTGDWVRVIVTDDARPADLYARVRARFPLALAVEHRPASERRGVAAVVAPGRDPLEVAEEFVVHVTGGKPSDAERDVLRQAYEQVLAAERSA